MENKKALFLITIIILFTGCINSRPVPVLTEGEIPYRLVPGIYEDTEGLFHEAKTNAPRWSVSEAYLFEEARNPNAESISVVPTFNKTAIAVGAGGAVTLFGLLISLVRKKIKIYLKKKLDSSEEVSQ